MQILKENYKTAKTILRLYIVQEFILFVTVMSWSKKILDGPNLF